MGPKRKALIVVVPSRAPRSKSKPLLVAIPIRRRHSSFDRLDHATLHSDVVSPCSSSHFHPPSPGCFCSFRLDVRLLPPSELSTINFLVSFHERRDETSFSIFSLVWLSFIDGFPWCLYLGTLSISFISSPIFVACKIQMEKSFLFLLLGYWNTKITRERERECCWSSYIKCRGILRECDFILGYLKKIAICIAGWNHHFHTSFENYWLWSDRTKGIPASSWISFFFSFLHFPISSGLPRKYLWENRLVGIPFPQQSVWCLP